jgi:uncharacterized membrane protein YebE (DUF533 family)
MDPEQLIGSLLFGGLSRRGRRNQRHSFSLGRTILSPQGLTILGGLAVAGYEYFKQKQVGSAGAAGGAAGVPGSGTPPPAATTAPGTDRAALAHLLIDAMVGAAKADGVMDPTEREALVARTAEFGAGETEQAYLRDQLEKPSDLESIVSRAVAARAQTDVYSASLLAVTVDTPAERAYLSLLAARLGLDEAAVADCVRRVETALQGS